MGASKPRVKIPEEAKPGDIIEVRTLVTHVMETGNRKDKAGNVIARDIINTFVAKYDDREVFRAELGPGISANPFIAFSLRVPGPGVFEFAWTDDSGTTLIETLPLNVV